MYSPAKKGCYLVLALTFVALAGCQNRGASPPPQTAVRSAAQTAPADLQLTCASEASTRLGLQNALPVSSSLAQANVYRVDLNAAGTAAVCMIRNDGTVVSVDRVG